MIAKLKQQMLFVRASAQKWLLRYEQHLLGDWQYCDNYREMVSMLILLPNLEQEKNLSRAFKMATVLDLTLLSQGIHNALKADGVKADYQHPILIGDYAFSCALEQLLVNGDQNWLAAYSNAHCSVNEARAVRSLWAERGFIPELERVDNYNKEYSEFPVLSARIGATFAGLSESQTESFTAFAYHAGVLSGMVRERFYWNWQSNLEQAYYYLAALDRNFADSLRESILQPLLEYLPGAGKTEGLSNALHF